MAYKIHEPRSVTEPRAQRAVTYVPIVIQAEGIDDPLRERLFDELSSYDGLPAIVRLVGTQASPNSVQLVASLATSRRARIVVEDASLRKRIQESNGLEHLVQLKVEDAVSSLAAENLGTQYRTDYSSWRLGKMDIAYVAANPARKIAYELGLSAEKFVAVLQLTQHDEKTIREKAWEALGSYLTGIQNQFDELPDELDRLFKDAHLLAAKPEQSTRVKWHMDTYVQIYEKPKAQKIETHLRTGKHFGAGK